jgi:hypothetical protein
MADGLFAYAPAQEVMSDADIAFAARDYQPWADDFQDCLDHYHIQVKEVLPVHFPPHTYAETVAFIKEGAKGLRERCAADKAAGIPWFGCQND